MTNKPRKGRNQMNYALIAELMMNCKFDELREMGLTDEQIFELYEKCTGVKFPDVGRT